MSCEICGWHPGFGREITASERTCPRVHIYPPEYIMNQPALSVVPDEPPDATMTLMALSATLVGVAKALEAAGSIEHLEHVDIVDLAQALDQLRGATDDDLGLIGSLQTLARDVENAIVAKIPLIDKGAHAGKPQKWTDIDGYRIERCSDGHWEIDHRAALREILGSIPLTVDTAVDAIMAHLNLARSWRTGELVESLGGMIVTEEPELDEAGNPKIISRGADKGKLRVKVTKVSPIVERGLGERVAGRDTVRLHKAESRGD